MRGDETRDLVAVLRDRELLGKTRRRQTREELAAAQDLGRLAAQG